MSSQRDATPWTIPEALSPAAGASGSASPEDHHHQQQQHQLLGRGYFSRLGIVRRKPARGDAPPTASKSCSDKLALRQCTSVLGSLAALFVSPRGAYLATLVVPASQYSAGACARCFRGRMRAVEGRAWRGTGYGFVGLRVETTGREFEFSRRAVASSPASVGGKDGDGDGDGEGKIKTAASNLAVAWTRDGVVEEGLIGGVLQGRKAFDVKGASLVSRRKMWAAAVEVAAALGHDEISKELAKETYDGVKEGDLSRARRRVKEEVREEALKGWIRNTGDGGFSL